MYVIKRDGVTKQSICFDKITNRIRNLTLKTPKLENVEPILIAQKVVSGLYSGVTTVELDNLAAETAVTMCTIHPEYEILASRIAISNLHKTTFDDYEKVCDTLYNYVNPKIKQHSPLITKQTYDIIKSNIVRIQEALNYEQDYTYDYLGIKTLQNSYLIKINGQNIERIQHLLMRVSIGIYQHDIDGALKTYHLLSQKYYTLATPTLFNAGTPNGQLSSCFLISTKSDSIEGIYDTLKQTALISKGAGGVGLSVHDVRAKNSYIKGTNGTAEGLVPMLKVFNDTARFVSQGGNKRKGSFAIYLELYHADIEDFLELKKNGGKEEMRARDLFYAVWVCDLFMERVEKDLSWSLFCPNECPGLSSVYGDEYVALYEKYEREGRARKTINAQTLWMQIMTSQIETGVPYLMYKDKVNKHNNQSNLGTIKSSNLCVSGDTYILTDQGQIPIKDLVDEEVNVWNGEEWSKTTVRQTGVNQEMVKVTLSNGVDIKCTPYHKFYTIKNDKVIMKEAKDLVLNDNLIKYKLPIIDFDKNSMLHPYTHGFFCGDGTYDKRGKKKFPKIYLYGVKKELLSYLKYTTYTIDNSDRINVVLDKNFEEKFYVPLDQSIDTKLKWLEGYFDADGCIVRNGINESIQAASIDKDFLIEIKLMLQTIGVDSKVTKNRNACVKLMPDNKGLGEYKEYQCKELFRLLISSIGLYNLSKLGFSPKRLKFTEKLPQRDAGHFIKIVGIKTIDNEDTYCFNEPLRHMGMFNGVLTGNCTEICEYTDENNVSICNLASVSLPSFIKNGTFDHQLLYDIIYHIVKDLNKVIDVNNYPVPEARFSNMNNRPVGVGIQGLADLFILLRVPFDSDEAKVLNQEILETMYYAAVKSSCDLAKIDGYYPSFPGSPASKGILTPDMWEHTPTNRWNFNDLRNDVVKFGMRNSLLIALMPTVSTAVILGNNESFEPYNTNVYVKRTLAGEFIVINKHLIRDLLKLGIWNEDVKQKLIANNGSVQGIHEIPDDIQLLYRTVWEVPLKSQIDMHSDRGVFVDQAQSFNVHMAVPTKSKLTSMHFYSWKKKGIKTSSYYIRSKSAVDPIKFTVNNEDKIIIYTKPTCKYCVQAKQLLKSKNMKFIEYNIENPDYKIEMDRKTNGAKTVPQIFMDGELIGGFDALNKLLNNVSEKEEGCTMCSS
jgi:ribonucleoside-diphosphate reductase alpha chain